MTFASTVKRLRLGAGLSQSALARELGVSTYTVKSWEAGRREPPISPALTTYFVPTRTRHLGIRS